MLLPLPLLLLLLLLTMQSAPPLILEMKLLHVIGQVATAQITLTSYLKHKGTEPAFTTQRQTLAVRSEPSVIRSVTAFPIPSRESEGERGGETERDDR